MLNHIKSTTKHTSVYALGNIISKVVGLVLIPIYTNETYLSNKDFGMLTLLEASAQLMLGVMSMAMASSLTRWYWDKRYIKIQKSIFFTTLSFLVSLVLPLAFLLISLSSYFSQTLFQSDEFSLLIKLTIISVSFQVLNNQTLTLAKVQSKSTMFTIVETGKFILNLILILYGVVARGMGLEAIWYASVFVEVLVFIVLLPYVKRNIVFKFQFQMLRGMLVYGLPLMLASVSSVILLVTDRFMLNSMSGLVETGIYGLGYRIANTLRFVVSISIMAALSPLRMQKMNDPDGGRFYSKALLYSGFIFTFLALAVSLFSYEIIVLFANSEIYYEAHVVVPIIALSLLFSLLKDNGVTGLSILKKTKIIGSLIALTGILNIGLNYFLIPIIGMYGAAMATVFSQFFLFVTIMYFAQKAHFIAYEWTKVVKMIGVAVGFVIACIFITELHIAIRVIIKLLLLFIYPFTLYYIKFFDKVEVDTVKRIFQTWRNPLKLKENIRRLLK